MKKSLMLILLIICMPFSYSIEVEKVSDVGEPDKLREVSDGVTRYVYGAGLVVLIKDSEISYYHSDRMQSNRLVTDSNGAVEKEFKSLPFGQKISNSGVKYAFATGKELDSSGLYYFGARYYDSDLGRFTSVDPIKENYAYSYVANNPLNFVDPTGMQEYEVSAYGEPPLTVGEETQEAITSLVTDCITLYGGMEDFDVVEGVALLASWTSWFDYEYDSSRAPQDDGTEGDWIRPYKRGGVLGVITNLFGIFYIKPELINVLEEGCSLCYEKAIYTKLVIDVAIDHLDIEGVETHMVDVPEHASVSVIFNPNTVTADTVFVDGGRLYSPSEYSEVIGLMTEDEETGFVFTNLNLDRID